MRRNDIGYSLDYTNLYLIDVTPDEDAPTWARLARGITNVTPSDSDTTEDFADYSMEGNTETDVTGGSYAYQFSGNRCYGDAAQDFIASKRFAKGADRVTRFKHIYPDGSVVEADVTVRDIVDGGGDPNAKATFSCTLGLNGTPDFSEPQEGAAVPTGLSAAAVNVRVGESVAAELVVSPAAASGAAAWAVDDEAIATVDDDGNVTGVKAGTCNLSFKSVVKPSVRGAAKVTVTAKSGS